MYVWVSHLNQILQRVQNKHKKIIFLTVSLESFVTDGLSFEKKNGMKMIFLSWTRFSYYLNIDSIIYDDSILIKRCILHFLYIILNMELKLFIKLLKLNLYLMLY